MVYEHFISSFSHHQKNVSRVPCMSVVSVVRGLVCKGVYVIELVNSAPQFFL
jgi:hypothetical protein